MNANKEIKKTLVKYCLRTFAQGVSIGAAAVLVNGLFTGEELLSLENLGILLLVGLGTTVVGVSNFMAYAKPFREIEGFISTIAKGDLTQDIRLDQLGSLKRFGIPMNGMREALQKLVSEVKLTSDQVQASIDVVQRQMESTRSDYALILQNLQTMDSGMRTQSVAAAESAKAVDEMAQGILRIAETSTSASTEAAEAAVSAVRSREDLSGMNAQMGRIRESFGTLTATIHELVGRTQEISGFIQSIRGISEQTNMLALNAGIEAARAGEQGKGFAVVASEIRKLATQSGDSAQKIGDVIGQIRTNSEQASSAMQLSEQEISRGLSVVASTEMTIRRILEAFEHINDQIREMSAVGEQMAAGSEEVAATVDNMAGTARHSAQGISQIVKLTDNVQGSMDEVSGAAERLEHMGGKLSELMNRFKV
ncbi:methyl-accepting chemotaxis protein [Paenibacillus mucilaginosus]|uniref:Methyl-accepting chemotaxis protein n=1 Tax=Paenibacillus mucilaginosus (strain KNP414) TaxID=1036673 RepID=F8FBH7_PAEMK|nr:methyl-accepting chemotaxis protein [Paenibacillus mucilaginosus]AEI42544.1 methyl-accepting chemotaxis protein [Paenibacillus mucilaginosus KNP414]MCG7213936.1 methyl-accepting chemotaxis protein [Paenibacillus mucilaginosus]WDM25939.1 chemotaxis protein [Paenibacillus mucilaginosus]